MKIEDIALENQIDSNLPTGDLVWVDPKKEPFRIHGLYSFDEEKGFCRMPKEIAAKVSSGVDGLNWNTAGGRVRFKTNSKHIGLKFTTSWQVAMDHMAYTGNVGFDLYKGTDESIYMGTFRQNRPCDHGYESIIWVDNPTVYTEGECPTYTINFPLYADVKSLYLAFDKDSEILPPDEYRITKPFLYYGSSITQGGCASRPGTCYQGFITRRFNADYINLGFSGAGKAEDVMIDYLSSLNPSIFICDYDHNAPNPEYLANTHSKLFASFRKAHPDTPVILVSRPDVYDNTEDTKKRFEIIKATYDNAVENGDKNVYLIDGRTLFNGENKCDCTVDGCHPTDLGFQRMGKVIGDVIEIILN